MEQKDHFVGIELIEEEFKKILDAKTGSPGSPFALTSAASKEVGAGINTGIQAHYNHAAMFDSMSHFFSRDNVGLPGVSLFFKVAAQVERNDAYLMADFLTKRGQHPVVGATHSPPRDFNFDSCSAVLGCFIKALAIAKVEYQKVSDLYKIATQAGDVHAVDFLCNTVRAVSYKMNQGAHYIAHLKIVEDNKLAMKEFDRRLPFELEDLAMAAGLESTLPSRLMMGSIMRAQMQQTKAFDFGKDAAESMRARAAFNQIV
ncbi:hypothetical protein ABBQ38_009147 [Trebouxia sp. C0009 RCD-2024]